MSEDIRPQNWSATAGETIRLPVPTFNADGTPTDLSGAVARFVMTRAQGAVPDVISYGADQNASATIPVPASGGVLVEISRAVTVNLLGRYYWQCDVTDVFGNEVTIAYGYATFRPTLIST